MNEIDLDALEATARAAVAGPWHHTPFGGQNQNGDYFGGDVFDGHGEYLLSEVRDEDGAHIAAFDPPTVLALVARLREAEAVIEVVEENLGGPKRMSDGYMSYFVTEDGPIRVALNAYKTTKTERDESEFAPGECDGSGTCTASVHVHGCYRPHRSDECDSPDEYGHTDRENGSRDA